MNGISSFGCSWQVTIVDPDGNVVEEASGHNSFLVQFAQLLKTAFDGSTASMRCIDSVMRNILWHRSGVGSVDDHLYVGFNIDTVPSEDDLGIVIGTGLTDVEIGDYKLKTKIDHGTSSGQFVYDTQTIADVDASVDEVWIDITRSFVNMSGETQAISEIGIYALVTDENTEDQTVCIIRDIVPGLIVSAGYVANVKYTLSTGF
jgi:hypothetical protein